MCSNIFKKKNCISKYRKEEELMRQTNLKDPQEIISIYDFRN